MAAAEAQGDNLTDDDLQSEIELVGDLVVAATSSDGRLPQEEIDKLLGVEPKEVDLKAEDPPASEPNT